MGWVGVDPSGYFEHSDKTSCFTKLGEGHTYPGVLGNVLRGICGHQEEEVAGGWRELQSEVS
jgi:hypothetical protein